VLARRLEDLKILIVDDQASMRLAIARLLAQLGARVVESAATGAEAIRMIEATDEPFDVAIFDLSMPTEDGLVCLRKLASLARLDRKPAVILMSGKDPLVLESAHRVGESLDVRVLGAVSKPLTGQALTRLLDALNRPEALARPVPPALLTEAEVRRGLEAAGFELWFQPQYHIPSRRVLGVEALVRLRHAERGVLGPASFIGPAEECGLIGKLTDFVLEQAATWCAVWQAGGWPLTVSVNLSNAGLDDLTLPDRAAAICESRKLAPSQLMCELTESSLATDATAVLDIMTRLRLKGFRLSLDDFGTGYASFEQLRSLPFHELKLDRQLVQGAVNNPRSRAILASTIRLASELNMSTVAEGVETDAMLQMVTGLGCQAAQGYLIGRPMPAVDVSGWLVQRENGRDPVHGRPARVDHGAQERGALPGGAANAQAPTLDDTVMQFAHDVANPLMMVLTLSELLLSDASVSQEHRPDISQIHDAAEEVSAMIKALWKKATESGPSGNAPAHHVPVRSSVAS